MTKLKRMRQHSGLTQSELAKKVNVNLRTLQYYEQGVKQLDHARIDTILKICLELGCDISDIMEEKEWITLYKKYADQLHA